MSDVIRLMRAMRFSIRNMLLLTAALAIAISIMAVWPRYGVMIAPSMLVVSFAIALITAFIGHPRVKLAFRSSLILFLAVACLYLSIGPASWIMARYVAPTSTAPVLAQDWIGRAYSHLYVPIATNAIYAPTPLRHLSFSYVRWWMPDSVEFEDMGKGMGWSEGPNWYTIVSYN